MPKSNITIAAPLREALVQCFHAATRLVRPERRRQLVLVGGAASIAHSSAITAGALNFSFESVAFKLDLLRLRAVTVVDRGSDGEVDDFRWLL
ncbi:hypothetical protein F4815DRAFT_445854 [Daldinia loculata]|nr:hypothetical protein F4815DRAFT_445854 [Daldinia loculata]